MKGVSSYITTSIKKNRTPKSIALYLSNKICVAEQLNISIIKKLEDENRILKRKLELANKLALPELPFY